MEYFIHLAILICIYLILAQGFNLQFGKARLFNLAHVACYSLGAYGVGLASTDYSLGLWPCLAIGIILSLILSVLISFISIRLDNDYFAVATLAFSFLVQAVLINWRSVTNGVLGIPGIPRPEIGSFDFYENLNFLYLALSLMLLSYSLSVPFFFGRNSRAFSSQAENKYAAESLGKNVAKVKFIALGYGALMAGLAGGLYAYYINYIDPSSFALSEMVFVFTVVILARPGSFSGVFAGTAFMILVPELFRFFEMPSSILGPARQALYAMALFFFLYVRRKTLFPKTRTL